MVGIGAQGFGKAGGKVGFDRFHCLAVREAYAACNPEYMGVHRNDGFPVNDGSYYVRRFSPYAGKLLQGFHVVRDDSPETSGKHLSHAYKVAGRYTSEVERYQNIFVVYTKQAETADQ